MYVSLLSVRAVEARNLLDQLENKKQKKKKKMERRTAKGGDADEVGEQRKRDGEE